jgi:hypothetical protein
MASVAETSQLKEISEEMERLQGIAYPGLERPTEFKTRPGQVLRVCQRERA